MTTEKALAELKELQKKLSAYGHALSLIFYDGVTGAPKATAENRAEAIAVLSAEVYSLSTDEKTVELLNFLDGKSGELTHEQNRTVYLMLKDIKDKQKIPADEYIEYNRLLVQADDVWHTAKETSDFALFEPVLEKIFETQIRFAGYLSPDSDPYDYWLGQYEDGLNKEICDKFFSQVKNRLVPLIKSIGKAKQVDDGILHGKFNIEAQRALSYELMKTMGLDLTHVGLSETEHPFTISIGSHNDVRITTNFNEDDFSSSMFSVIHEGGHALYDTGSRSEYAYTVLDGGVSMGIHESQSRFYENIIGRSKSFAKLIFPKVAQAFDIDEKYSYTDLYRAVNKSCPSLIRTEADEITYCLHVMIRYELEKAVMSGELSVHELPSAWNRMYKEYLGVDVPDDKHGVLQDSHWSGGSIGYFPSYALGSAYGAQFIKKMKESIDVDACIESGDFAPINEWNREHIWQYRRLYTPKELLERVLGEPFDADVYLDYLENKAKDVYGI